MEQCPCCKAKLRGNVICSRCKADLKVVIQSKKTAEQWLSQAIVYWSQGAFEYSIASLEYSLALNNTKLAEAFKDYMIYQKSNEVVDLLARRQLLPAKKVLCNIQKLFPYSHTLKEINLFTDHLL